MDRTAVLGEASARVEWSNLLAQRASSLHGWARSDLSAMVGVPDLIHFGDGVPALDCMPVERLRAGIVEAWSQPETILDYDESAGHLPLREAIAERMRRRTVDVSATDILITNGSQQGLDLAAKILFDPGDTVIVEGPTYFGALQAFDAYQVRYEVVAMDADGMLPEALEDILRTAPRVKALYTVPTFQNPAGVTLSPERRARILELAGQYGIAVIEDDPYGDLYLEGEPVRPLRAQDQHVIYLGSFSKTLAPALRMGWMVAPPEILKLAEVGKEGVDIMSDRFVQRAVSTTIANGWLDEHLVGAREIYRKRRDGLIGALEREMPDGVSWTFPRGGFFSWMSLPETVTAEDLLQVAVRHGVSFLPGSCFFPDQQRTNALRLSYPTMPSDRINEGIRRLGVAVREALG